MKEYHISKHSSFYAIGISYKKADTELRGRFSLSNDALATLLHYAKKEDLEGVLVIATCNRTEIYGFAQNAAQLIKLLCSHTVGREEEFRQVAYILKNQQAIDHLFKVGTGLDSQILGDFEIISQIKTSHRLSKERGLSNPFLERLINAVITSSKRIKNETELSSGATSVSFASVQYIFENIIEPETKNILLYGLGKIGRNTCENLLKHTGHSHITLINRTREKAEELGSKFKVHIKDHSQLQEEIRMADILVVATGALFPTITPDLIHNKKPLLILDLSIPHNVDPKVAQLEQVDLVHLDQLSKITGEAMDKRRAQIPLAKAIIKEVMDEFLSWLETRRFAPTIKALKEKLKELQEDELNYHRKKFSDFNDEQAHQITERLIHKITTQFANHLKESNGASAESMALIKKVFQLEKELP